MQVPGPGRPSSVSPRNQAIATRGRGGMVRGARWVPQRGVHVTLGRAFFLGDMGTCLRQISWVALSLWSKNPPALFTRIGFFREVRPGSEMENPQNSEIATAFFNTPGVKKKSENNTPPDKKFCLRDIGTCVKKNRGGLCLIDLSRTPSGTFF